MKFIFAITIILLATSLVEPGSHLKIGKENSQEIHTGDASALLKLIHWCENARIDIVKKTQKITDKISSLPFLKNGVYVYKNFTVENLHIESDALVPVYSDDFFEDFVKEMKSMETELKEINEGLNDANEISDNAINVNETKAWPNNLRLSSVVILEGEIENFFANEVDNIRIPKTDELIPLYAEEALELSTKTFSNVKVNKHLNVDFLNGYHLSTYMTTNKNETMSGKVTLVNAKSSVIKVGGKVDTTKIDPNSLLLKSGSDRFDGEVRCKDATITRLNTHFINNIDLDEIELYSRRNEVVLHGDLTITGNLIHPGNLKSKIVNGINIKKFERDVLKLNSAHPQNIKGSYKIKSLSVPDLNLDGTINSIAMKDVFVNDHTKYYYVPKAYFDSLTAKRVSVDTCVNEIQVNDKELDLFLLNKDQIVTGLKSFHKINLSNRFKNESMNSQKKFDIVKNSSWDIRKKYEKINLKRKFVKEELNKVTFLKNIEAFLANVLKVVVENEDSDILLAKISKILNTMKKFYNHNILKYFDSTHNNLVAEFITLSKHRKSEVHFTKQQLNFQTYVILAKKNISEIIFNKKSQIEKMIKQITEYDSQLQFDSNFYNFRVSPSSNSFVTGLVSGYEFKKSRKDKIASEVSEDIQTKLKNADYVYFKKGLHVIGLINGVNINKLMIETLPLTSNKINANFIFKKPVSVREDFSATSLNDIPVSNVARLNSANVFEKPVIFRDIEVTKSLNVKDKLNGYDLNTLNDITTQYGVHYFNESVKFESLIIPTYDQFNVELNRIPISDCAFKFNEAVISGNKKFETIKIIDTSLEVESLNADNLGDIDLKKLKNDSEAYNGNLVKLNKKEFKSIIVTGNVDVTSTIKSSYSDKPINVEDLFNNAILKNQENTLSGHTKFSGAVVVKNLFFNDTFDGVNTEILENGLVINDVEQTLTKQNSFKNFKVKNLFIKDGILQGVDLNRLFEKTAKIDENTTFRQRVFIESATTNQVTVDGLVNDVNLTRDAVLKSDFSPMISGAKSFLIDLKISSEFQVKGLINGKDFDILCNEANGEVWIEGPVHFEREASVGKLHKKGQLFPTFDVKSYWMKNKPTKFQSVVFHQIFAENVKIVEKFNGEPVDDILHGRLSSKCNGGEIREPWFIDSLKTNFMETNFIKAKLLNGESNEILHNILLDGKDQSFKRPLIVRDVKFENFNIYGKLNGLSMKEFCKYGKKCRVNAKKSVANLNIENDWKMSTDDSINGLSISELKDLEPHPVRVLLNGSVTTESLNVTGTVQHIKFDSDHVMLLSGEQTMDGTLHILNPSKLALNASNVKISSNKINDVNVKSLETYQAKNSELEKADSAIDSILNRYQKLHENIWEVQSTLNNSAIRFDGWKTVHEKKDVVKSVQLTEQSSRLLLAAFVSENKVEIWSYTSNPNGYKLYATINLNGTTDAEAFYIGNSIMIATSTGKPNYGLNLSNIQRVSLDNKIQSDHYTYLWEFPEQGAPKLKTVFEIGGVSQLIYLQIVERNCLLLVSNKKRTQNIVCQVSSMLRAQQRIEIGPVTKALLINDDKNQTLALVFAVNDHQFSSVNILQFIKKTDEYGRVQTIEAEDLTGLCAEKFNGKQFLASVHQAFSGSLVGKIKVYMLKIKNNMTMKFVLEETILVHDPVEATMLSTPHELFLLVLDKNQMLTRFVKRGCAKFKKVTTISLKDASSVSSWRWDINDVRHLVIVKKPKNSKSELMIWRPTYHNEI